MFGYIQGIPEGEGQELAWGARAILENGSFSLLHDRQGWFGTYAGNKEAAERMVRHLKETVYDAMDMKVRRLIEKGDMRPDKAEHFFIYEDELCKAACNTNASYGYLYIIVWAKPKMLEGKKDAEGNKA